MSFDEQVAGLLQRLPKLVEHLQTEQATKNALVLPFISALGYDIFNPQEVVPEFVADVGTKKGEKVDYAITRDGEVILLIECKKCQTDLSQADTSQLYRYFSVARARIAVLTNGVQYWFYCDLVEPNKMDTRPFLELDLSDPRPGVLTEVKKLAKEGFDLDMMLSAANELKYTSEFKKIMATQFEQPDQDFVKFFFRRAVPSGHFSASAKAEYTPLVAKAFQQLISDRVSDRLKNALQSESKATEQKEDTETDGQPLQGRKDGIATTEEELEGFRIVRAIVCRVVSPERVYPRDTKTNLGILLDNTSHKPICRLWFNSPEQKYLSVWDAEKKETKIPIDTLVDIYKHSDRLVQTVQKYEVPNVGA